MGQYVSIAASDGSGRSDAYLAFPANGKGSGVVTGQKIFGVNANMRTVADLCAEEGYVALIPDLFWRLQLGADLDYGETAFAKAIELLQRIGLDAAVNDIIACTERLRQREEVVCAGTGFVGFCIDGKPAYLVVTRTGISCSVSYYGMGIKMLLDEVEQTKGRLVLHFAKQDVYYPQQVYDAILPCLCNLPKTELHLYSGVGHTFVRVGGMYLDRPTYLTVHERSIVVLKREIRPSFGLFALWDEHVRHKFDTHSVAATVATMVAEPYVDHAPTPIGGIGQRKPSRLYRHHFIHDNPPDMTLTPVSRAVGTLRVVDEFVMRSTHSCEIDWLLPGAPPTERFVEIPIFSVVRLRGDRPYHGHIYWDQIGVLTQIGLLGLQGLPVVGVESTRKPLDGSLPSDRPMVC